MVNRQISLDQGIHLVTRSLEALIAWEGVWGRVERAGGDFFDKWVISRVPRVPG